MSTGVILSITIGVAILAIVATVLVLKYGFKWVNVKDIPEEEVEKVAKRIMGDRMKNAEKEMDEMKNREERRLKQMRKESQDHEEILIERERKLN